MPRRFVAVRPYGPRIRERVFAILEHAGLRQQLVLAPTLTDRQVVTELARLPSLPDLLLVPYHARLEPDGGHLRHGLSALAAIWERLPAHWREIPVLMPVSRLSRSAFRISWYDFALRFAISEPEAARILVLHEARLEREPVEGLAREIVRFLQSRPSTRGTPSEGG